MPTILADSFTAALGRLASDEQEVKLTVFDLQTEPDRPGLQFHRIDNSRDPNFWSVRVSRDIRIYSNIRTIVVGAARLALTGPASAAEAQVIALSCESTSSTVVLLKPTEE
jgi:hypothetical protein